MSEFTQVELEGNPKFSYEKNNEKEYWLITAPPNV